MTYEEKLAHAKRIGKEHFQDFEFLSVVEDEELEDATEEEMLEIHDMITNMIPSLPNVQEKD